MAIMFTVKLKALPKFNSQLNNICFRDIKVDFKKNLVKIDHTKKEATFETIGSDPAETEVSQVQTHRFR